LKGSVVYLGTFAKSLSPALRVGYIVLPQRLLTRYNSSFDKHFSRVSITTQKTLELFINEGHWARHLRRIRTLNRKKHDLLKSMLKKYLKDSFYILAEGAGLAILIHPNRPFDWKRLKQESKQAGIKIYLAKARSGGEFEAVRMGFGGFKLEEIEEAVKAFAKVWHLSFL
jgi:GntR family transcriptional regulator/MocR family aminotransferase